MGDVAALICAISFALLMLAGMIVALKLARTMAITNRILNDIRKETLPLMTRVETAMDHVNGEIERLDGVLESLQKVAGRFDSATRTVQRLVASPFARLLTLGMGVQRALGMGPAARGRSEAAREE